MEISNKEYMVAQKIINWIILRFIKSMYPNIRLNATSKAGEFIIRSCEECRSLSCGDCDPLPYFRATNAITDDMILDKAILLKVIKRIDNADFLAKLKKYQREWRISRKEYIKITNKLN